MWWKSFAKAGALLAALIVAACTVTYDDPPNRPRPPNQPYCTREYDPVCARRGNDRETFNNSCLAEAAGYRVIRRGECKRDDNDDRYCSRQYDPVCARRNGQFQTFPNECEAEAAGWRVVSDGQCQASPPPRPQPPAPPPPPPPPPAPPPPAGACDGYKPVCGIRGAQYQTFANICALQGSGFQFVMQGACGGLEQKP